MSIQKVLVANRGEIAVRIIRTLHELGIQSVAVYADNDKEGMHVTLADEVVPLGQGSLQDTYLNIEKIVSAAKVVQADAIHPGYGFLSENGDFAEAVEKENLIFIGPNPDTIRTMGNKVTARNLMKDNGVPVVPGTGTLENIDQLKTFIDEVGLPVLLKASAGGGGRGMRQIHDSSEIEQSFEACQREAQAFFNDSRVFCEKLVTNPRHIEFQILFDQHGNGVHLFERDCSIQRRHQKLFEEAPSQYLNAKQRKKMGEIAIQAGKATHYRGAGTVEFICESPDHAWFMEMNTRIQVEHPVTEMITGIDLIAEQIRVANGEKLSFQQEELQINGWALEARINAEDPSADFRPCPGKTEQVRFPHGPFVRVETHLYPGYEIPESYDSMVAKVLAWGRTRDEALKRLARALRECEFSIPTTCAFHQALIAHEDFVAGNFSTHFLAEHQEKLKNCYPDHQLAQIQEILAACKGTPPQPQIQKVEQSQWHQISRREGIHT